MIEYLIWLHTALGAGNPRGARALDNIGSAEQIYKMNDTERRQSGIFTPKDLERLRLTKLGEAKAIEKECRRHGITLLAYGDNKYPEKLRVIAAPPILLYLKGKLPNVDETPAVCIVGPRKSSEFGQKAAYSLGYRLASAGMTVVSGGARGSDFYAHSGALKAEGKTVLVMGCGIESDYLPENAALRRAVAEDGCLVSEYPPFEGASKYTFPVRNRLMSALADTVIITEAGMRSGALNTANHALNQGKEIFVIPGSPADENYAGSNALLRDGARPLLDISDILNEYLPRYPDKIDIEKAVKKRAKPVEERAAKPEKTEVHKKLSIETLSNEAKIVYNQLNKPIFYPDEINNTSLEPGDILAALTELEIEGLIRSLPGGRYELIKN